jgi:hypothetical protein
MRWKSKTVSRNPALPLVPVSRQRVGSVSVCCAKVLSAPIGVQRFDPRDPRPGGRAAVPTGRLTVPSRTRRKTLCLFAAATSLALVLAPLSASPAAVPDAVVDRNLARSPELSETRRLADRRVVITGDRAWAMGTADGYYPAAGFHTRGEMGGFWLPDLKLLDGMWFGINGDWIGPATRTTSGWGYVRADLPTTDAVGVSRTDFVPDGVSGALVGLTLRADRDRTIRLDADAHSELLRSYPVGRDDSKPDHGESAGLAGRGGRAPGVPRPGHPIA